MMVNYLVSGCPRSGTSMLMRILSNAGMPIAKDDLREADKDNQHGYFEIKDIIDKIRENPKVVFDYEGKVLKVTHYGLKFLSEGDYKILYIERDLDEVMLSMEKMTGKEDPNRAETKLLFKKLNEQIKRLMEARKDIDFLLVNYREIITDPEPSILEIIDFFGIDPAKKEAMIQAVDPTQYRNKKGNSRAS